MPQLPKPPSPPPRRPRASATGAAEGWPRHPLGERLLDYWLAKPEACDSAEGIAQWWLDPPVTPRALQVALDELVELGLAHWRAGAAGQAGRYALAITAAELRALLAHRPSRPPAGRGAPH